MTKPVKLNRGDRVVFNPIIKTFLEGTAGKTFVFDGDIDIARGGRFDHRLRDDKGGFIMWADRRELRKLPDRK